VLEAVTERIITSRGRIDGADAVSERQRTDHRRSVEVVVGGLRERRWHIQQRQQQPCHTDDNQPPKP
jgi:hypothetical protein